MKNVKIMMIAVGLVTAAIAAMEHHAAADDTDSAMTFKGKISLMLSHVHIGNSWSGPTDDTVHSRSKLVVSTWGEGKVAIIMTTQGDYHCPGIQKTFVGYQTAYQVYDLFVRAANDPNPTPTASRSAGQLTLVDRSAFVALAHDLTAATSNENGPCDWTIKSDTAIELEQ